MIVLDASALLDSLVRRDAFGYRVRRRLGADLDQNAPAVVKAETLTGLRRLVAAGEVSVRQGAEITRSIPRLEINTYPIDALVPRVWGLRHNLSVYDAWYVALAEALNTILVTTDGKLSRAPGVTCEVELID